MYSPSPKYTCIVQVHLSLHSKHLSRANQPGYIFATFSLFVKLDSETHGHDRISAFKCSSRSVAIKSDGSLSLRLIDNKFKAYSVAGKSERKETITRTEIWLTTEPEHYFNVQLQFSAVVKCNLQL